MQLHHVRRGVGKPLLLVPGLGATWQSWDTIFDALAREREVIAIDLPGFGATPPLPGEVSVATLRDAVAGFIDEQNLAGIDLVGSSMGARMVLELARRGVGGSTVALNPADFGALASSACSASRSAHRSRWSGRCSRCCRCSPATQSPAPLHWFDHCGHFPHWDVPAATIRFILASTA
ncbi:MAG: alpha/beta fold hydrolase [Pseudonocardiaceae bacterium]